MQPFDHSGRLKVFIPDDQYVWLSADVINETAEGSIVVEITDVDFSATSVLSQRREISSKLLQQMGLSSLPLDNDDIPDVGVDDLTILNYLHEASILDNLRRRYSNCLPYTYTGEICIAINPYRWLNHFYTQQHMEEHTDKLRHELKPHVYATSAAAYRGLKNFNRNQSILVSGESGAGKTETVKILMAHLAQISSDHHKKSLSNHPNHSSLSIISSTTSSAAIHSKHHSVAADTTTNAATSTTIEKVLQANPLLETFGNAKTVRNDNSSRFGKFTQLQFDPFTVLIGSKCVTYLLEKSRVCAQNENERNYHIFHQIFAAPEDTVKSEIHLFGLSAIDFQYTCLGDVTTQVIEGDHDSVRFEQTVAALKLLGVSDQEIKDMLRIIAGILYLGQISFVGDSDDSALDPQYEDMSHICCELLGISQAEFCVRTTTRKIEAEGQEMSIHLSRDQAFDSRDALAKDIYDKLFSWLVSVINASTIAPSAAVATASGSSSYNNNNVNSERLISLLDIFGFESFRVNRFEQFCINYANEKLQQKFTQDVFQAVQREYREEGLEWESIGYKDNADVLELLEGKLGVMALLNEECLVPKGSDNNFLNKTISVCKSHPCFGNNSAMGMANSSSVSSRHTNREEFTIAHYAGRVSYTAQGFLEKNRDALPSDLTVLMNMSENTVVRSSYLLSSGTAAASGSGSVGSLSSSSPFPSGGRRPMAQSTRGGAGGIAALSTKGVMGVGGMAGDASSKRSSYMKAETVTTKFRGQLEKLMQEITITNVQYVRCIKPNSVKSPTVYDRDMVVTQLRCAGMIEAIRISRAAYPYRVTHTEFLGRFGNLRPKLKNKMKSFANNKVAQCLCLLGDIWPNVNDLGPKARGVASLSNKAYEIGKTKVYFSNGVLETLEHIRGSLMHTHTTMIQKTFRCFLVRRWFLFTRSQMVIIQKYARKFIYSTRFKRLRSCVVSLQREIRRFVCQRRVQKLRIFVKVCGIQTAFRRYVKRKSFLRIRKHAVKVIEWYKTIFQRRKYLIRIVKFREDQNLQRKIELLSIELEAQRLEREKLEIEKQEKIENEKLEISKNYEIQLQQIQLEKEKYEIELREKIELEKQTLLEMLEKQQMEKELKERESKEKENLDSEKVVNLTENLEKIERAYEISENEKAVLKGKIDSLAKEKEDIESENGALKVELERQKALNEISLKELYEKFEENTKSFTVQILSLNEQLTTSLALSSQQQSEISAKEHEMADIMTERDECLTALETLTNSFEQTVQSHKEQLMTKETEFKELELVLNQFHVQQNIIVEEKDAIIAEQEKQLNELQSKFDELNAKYGQQQMELQNQVEKENIIRAEIESNAANNSKISAEFSLQIRMRLSELLAVISNVENQTENENEVPKLILIEENEICNILQQISSAFLTKNAEVQMKELEVNTLINELNSIGSKTVREMEALREYYEVPLTEKKMEIELLVQRQKELEEELQQLQQKLQANASVSASANSKRQGELFADLVELTAKVELLTNENNQLRQQVQSQPPSYAPSPMVLSSLGGGALSPVSNGTTPNNTLGTAVNVNSVNSNINPSIGKLSGGSLSPPRPGSISKGGIAAFNSNNSSPRIEEQLPANGGIVNSNSYSDSALVNSSNSNSNNSNSIYPLNTISATEMTQLQQQQLIASAISQAKEQYETEKRVLLNFLADYCEEVDISQAKVVEGERRLEILRNRRNQLLLDTLSVLAKSSISDSIISQVKKLFEREVLEESIIGQSNSSNSLTAEYHSTVSNNTMRTNNSRPASSDNYYQRRVNRGQHQQPQRSYQSNNINSSHLSSGTYDRSGNNYWNDTQSLISSVSTHRSPVAGPQTTGITPSATKPPAAAAGEKGTPSKTKSAEAVVDDGDSAVANISSPIPSQSSQRKIAPSMSLQQQQQNSPFRNNAIKSSTTSQPVNSGSRNPNLSLNPRIASADQQQQSSIDSMSTNLNDSQSKLTVSNGKKGNAESSTFWNFF